MRLIKYDPVADVDKVTEQLEFLFVFHTAVEVGVDVYRCCLDCKFPKVIDTPKVDQTRLLLP